MLIIDIATRFGKELIRLKITVAVLIIMPAFMGFMFWFAFSATGLEEAQTYTLGVINNDEGIADELAEYFRELPLSPITNSTLDNGFAADFIKMLSTINYTTDEDVNKSIFTVDDYSNQITAIKAVEEREIDALVIFDEDYSNTTLSAVNNAYYVEYGIYLHNISIPIFNWTGPLVPTSYNSTIHVIGDEGYVRYQIASFILRQIFDTFNEDVRNLPYSGGNIFVIIKPVTLRDYSVFEMIMPGILVFSILMQAGMLAAFLVEEFAETKTITRVRLSLIKPYEYVAGVTIFQFIISLGQMLILLGISMLIFQFNPAGDVLQGLLVLMLATIFTTALGFILAGIFTSSDTAGQSSGFIMTPLAFMSGAFMEVPTITLIPDIIPTPSGLPRDFLLWDILPTTHAVNSLRSIILYKFNIFDVWADIVLLVLPSLILLGVGMAFYTKRRFSGDIP